MNNLVYLNYNLFLSIIFYIMRSSYKKFIGGFPQNNIESCPICLEEVIPTDVQYFETVCNHIFHKKCIYRFIKRTSFFYIECPLCRRNLNREDIISKIVNELTPNEVQNKITKFMAKLTNDEFRPHHIDVIIKLINTHRINQHSLAGIELVKLFLNQYPTYISELNDDIKEDKQFALSLVGANRYDLLSDTFKYDINFIKEALQINPLIYEQLSLPYKLNKDIAKQAVLLSIKNYPSLPFNLKEDREFINELFKKSDDFRRLYNHKEFIKVSSLKYNEMRQRHWDFFNFIINNINVNLYNYIIPDDNTTIIL